MEKKLEKLLKKHYPLLVILALPCFLFAKAIIGTDLIVAGDFSGSDLLDLHLPFKAAIRQALNGGFLPLWTPYLDGGYPLLAEGQMGFFYPINLLLGWLPIQFSLNFSLIFVFFVSGVSTYLYARQIKLKVFPALVASIAFAFSAFFVIRIKHLNLINVASLFPLAMLWIEKYFTKFKLKYFLLLGITLGLQLLAGHPQMAFYCLLIYLLTILFKLVWSQKNNQRLPLGQALTGLFLTALISLGIGAIQIIPTAEMTWLSSRPGYVFEQIAMYPFHPKNLLTFFSPYAFGNPATGTYRENIRQMGIFWENASYLGILPLTLAFYSLLAFLKKKKELSQKQKSQIIFYFFLFTFSLLLMLGQYTPIFSTMVKIVPLASLFRFPTRFNLFAIFSLAVLAGLGTQLLLKNLKGVQFKRFHWPLTLSRTKILILALILVDLFSFSKDYLGSLNTQQWLDKPESVKFLEEDQSLFKIYSATQYTESPYQTLGWKNMTEPLMAIREGIPPNHNLIHQIGTISDRSWFEGGLPVLRHYRFERWLLDEVKNEFVLGKILGMFNVKYLISYASSQNPEFEMKKEINLGEIFGLTLKILENKQDMGPIYFVPEAKVIQNEDQVLKEMAEINFYPPKTVILEEEPEHPLEAYSGILDEFKENNQLSIENHQPLEVKIQANLADKGFLVLPETPYPGWQATIDNQPTKIYTANYLMRAVYLEPGDHEVIFRYSPLSFKIGAGVTSTTLLGLALVGLASLFKKALKLLRRRSKDPNKQISNF
ncbi:YfhO family protein [Patescibacteria group bacterium]